MPKISLQHKIKSAVKAYEAGNIKVAKRLLKKIIQIEPANSEANHIMGLTLIKDNKAEASLNFFKVALESNFGVAQYWFSYIDALFVSGKLQESLDLLKVAKSKGCRGKSFDDLEKKITSPKAGLQLKVQRLSKLIESQPGSGLAYLGLAEAFREQGKFDEALNAYTTALKLTPNSVDAHLNVGIILMDQGKLEEAIVSFKNAISIKPSCAEAYNNMGVALKVLDNLPAALEAYNNALSINPDYVHAWLNGAEALEKWNKIEQLGLWLEKALQSLKEIPADILLMRAIFFLRIKAMPEATKVILSINFESISVDRQPDFFIAKAKCFEFLNNFDAAYDCFLSMNSLVKKTDNYLKSNPEKYFNHIKSTLRSLNTVPIQKPAIELMGVDDFEPVFLIGFPRSGTTLLDTILRSHTCIEVAEEKPALGAAKTFIKKSDYSHSVSMVLPQEIIFEARKSYQAEFEKHIVGGSLESVCIDKLPLNILDTPLIHKLYPKAKFILALRHPMDTILSCWMQNFVMNAAMANMVDLDRIVEFYCTAMEIFQKCRTEYNLNVHTIRYEDLIEDLRGESEILLNFLGLSWEPQMENFQRTAIERGHINTPSYSQVSQPIYKDAKYRWLHYEKYLEKYLDKTGPWISEFKYHAF